MIQKNRKHPAILLGLVILIIAMALIWRIHQQQRQFQELVAKTAQITEGYDENFIAMVDRLEHELAERASFPYLGKKDPMTGKVRQVVIPQRPRERERIARRTGKAPTDAPIAQATETATTVVAEVDPVRLTAVIYDDIKRVHTAIMMVGERSYSVEVGDRIHGRRAAEITVSSVTLEDQNKIYQYNISGQSSSRAK